MRVTGVRVTSLLCPCWNPAHSVLLLLVIHIFTLLVLPYYHWQQI